ncbi:MAG: LuxR C-terminal-related transcriptional regulator [Chloroflexota bacterium]|nr:LuxR C-terminal-related transcriptional regulator [Chloroflexota bacterium]
MEEILLSTKLNTPITRRELVPRHLLIKRLVNGLFQEERFSRVLTLVSAPAGYGKTTLVVDWLQAQTIPYTWLSLDENDNDPVRFLSYLFAAISLVDPILENRLKALAQHPQMPPPDVLMTSLVNELSSSGVPFILALDDFHTIQSPEIHQQVDFLLEHHPANMHVAITTREDPPLPLARLRAQGQVLEIRQSDLSFSLDETGKFLRNIAQLNIQEGDIATLAKHTEGWVVGLQLAALSMQGVEDLSAFVQSFTGSNRYILDYLFDEVFDRQTEHVQDFLIKTSILEHLSAPLCDAVTGRSDSASLLHSLESENLFTIPLDQTRTWYRYHHLFLDLLQHRLRISKYASLNALHLSASQWYEDHGNAREAIWHALLSEDWERSTQMIHHNFGGLLRRGELITLHSWIRRLPEQEIRSNPPICVDLAWLLVLSGKSEEAEPYLSLAAQAATTDSQLDADIAAARAFIARSRGDNLQTIESSQRALSLLPDNDYATRGILAVNLGIAFWHTGQLRGAKQALNEAQLAYARSGNRYAELTAIIFQNRLLAAQGQLQDAYQAYLPVIEMGRQIPILALAHLDLGALHYEWNELEECEQSIKESLTISERTRNGEFQISGYMQMARLRLAEGNLGAALNHLQHSDRLLQEYSVTPLTRLRCAALHVQIALEQENLAGAHSWAEQAGDQADAHPFYPFLGLSEPRLLLAQHQYTQAKNALDTSLEKAEDAGWVYGALTIRTMRSLAAGLEGDALSTLIPALKQAQPEGYIRSFADLGRSLIPLLHEAARRGVTPAYVGKILAAMETKPKERGVGKPALIEPLSEREMEVMRLVAAGLSNRQIARQLIISLGTVKTHIHNIYAKLEVRNRTQAVARAREIQLI